MLNIIFSYVNKRVKINVKKLENNFGVLPEEIFNLVESYNNSLNASIEEATDEYVKDITSERNSLREENAKHIEELEALKNELLRAQALITELQKENVLYRERENSMRKILSM